jgi:prolyl-tRNA synthetase
MMKDLYSFHLTDEDIADYYLQVKDAYMRIFARVGLNAIYTDASGGVFTKYRSHEFQVLAESGEDEIYLNQLGDRAWNKELVNENDPEFLQFCEGVIDKRSAIEVGNIFRFDNKYSAPLNAAVTNKSGERIDVLGASYGIGITRLIGTIAEVYGDIEKSKINWPKSVAPYKIHLIELGQDLGQDMYNEIVGAIHELPAASDILYDDRDESAGTKFADADLIGAPMRIIISSRTLERESVELNGGLVKLTDLKNKLT